MFMQVQRARQRDLHNWTIREAVEEINEAGEAERQRIKALEEKFSKLLLAIRQSGVADAIPEFEELWKGEMKDDDG